MAELPGFVGGSYPSESPWADQEYTMNWYVEPVESRGASTRAAMYPTPGVETLATAASGPGSAHFAQAGLEFCIIGNTFYEVGVYGALTSRGTVAVDANPGTICSNGDGGGQIFVTSGGNGYIYTIATNAFAQIANLDGLATMGAYLDGYFLALDTATSTVYISDLVPNAATWDPLQYFQRSVASDPWISMVVANRYIYLFGSETSEVYYDEGAFPIPFVAHPSGLIQIGCAAAFSVDSNGTSVTWLSRTANGDGGAHKMAGFTPEKISNFATETAFGNYLLEDAVGESYEENGHTFYIVTFRNSNATWCYDESTGVWHQRGTWITEMGEFDFWHPMYHAFAFGEHRMLDLNSGKLYRMANDIGTDADGRVIRRVRRSPAVFNENKRVFISSFELNLETGLGLVSGQGSDPQVMMRYSNDGGKTWGSQLTATAGAIGQYGTRVKWNRMGMARRRVFEVSVTDPIPWRLMGAYIELSPSADSQGQAAA